MSSKRISSLHSVDLYVRKLQPRPAIGQLEMETANEEVAVIGMQGIEPYEMVIEIEACKSDRSGSLLSVQQVN